MSIASLAEDFGINHSFYFLQYVKRVESEIPSSLKNSGNREELEEMLQAIREYNDGSKDVTCY